MRPWLSGVDLMVLITRVGSLAGARAVLLDSACLGPQDFAASAYQREKSLDGRRTAEYLSAGLEGRGANRAFPASTQE